MRYLEDAPKDLREQWIWIMVNSFAAGYRSGIASEEACWRRILKYILEEEQEFGFQEMLQDENVYLTARDRCQGGYNMPYYQNKDYAEMEKSMLAKLEETMKKA